MAKILGRQRAAGWGKESTYGTPVAATHWIPFQEFSLEDQVTTLTDNSGIGTRDEVRGVDTDYLHSEGSQNGIIYDKSFGLIALGAWGSVNTANHSTADGVKVHTYSIANTLPSFTISTEDANEEGRFAGVMVNQLTMSGTTGGYASYSADLLGRKFAASSVTPSFTEEVRFPSKYVRLYFADSVAELDSATKFCATDFTFTLNNNLSTNPCLGSEDPNFDHGVLGMTLEFNRIYVDTTFKAFVTGQAKKAFRIELKNTAIAIGTDEEPSNNTNPTIQIDFEPGMFSSWSREGGLDDLMTEAVSFTPIRSYSQAKAAALKITNLETSY